ncbi:hypothetical protein BLA23254_05055 [Burkholderia lata]|uniref:Uncharacterized protein n=1 Tax=Burkholderia lata (strain ATCC 17760 / DSM 23089 / LMG 22485 / NCIMB 9086 / R18194 / 383) TaxID=482957 RepID=A0A6P2PHE8_BURL3|nr:hypothetical protein BLA23254_05055 [Burkholderia lata]
MRWVLRTVKDAGGCVAGRLVYAHKACDCRVRYPSIHGRRVWALRRVGVVPARCGACSVWCLLGVVPARCGASKVRSPSTGIRAVEAPLAVHRSRFMRINVTPARPLCRRRSVQRHISTLRPLREPVTHNPRSKRLLSSRTARSTTSASAEFMRTNSRLSGKTPHRTKGQCARSRGRLLLTPTTDAKRDDSNPESLIDIRYPPHHPIAPPTIAGSFMRINR